MSSADSKKPKVKVPYTILWEILRDVAMLHRLELPPLDVEIEADACIGFLAWNVRYTFVPSDSFEVEVEYVNRLYEKPVESKRVLRWMQGGDRPRQEFRSIENMEQWLTTRTKTLEFFRERIRESK